MQFLKKKLKQKRKIGNEKFGKNERNGILNKYYKIMKR